MKKLLSLLAITATGLVAAPGFTLAADHPATASAGATAKHGEHMHAAERLKLLAEKLGLTQEQKDKIKPIIEKSAPEIRAILSKGRANPTADDKAKLMEIFKNERKEIVAILTPEQKAKFKEIREEHRAGKTGAAKPAGT